MPAYFLDAKVTFFGKPDNDPPGSEDIAHPGTKGNPPVKHLHAGGAGTYLDPVTVACKALTITTGARVYFRLPGNRQGFYGIIEDTCGACTSHPLWLDIWIGGGSSPAAIVIACEERLTPSLPIPVLFNPPPDLPVRGPLFDGTCHP